MPPVPHRSPHTSDLDPRYNEFAGAGPSQSDFAIESERDRRTRPTLSDIDVLPRRRLRDGSTSTSTSRSSGATSGSGLEHVQTRFGALREQSLARARYGIQIDPQIKPPTRAASPVKRKARFANRRQSVISISSDDGIEIIEPVKLPKVRWTAQEKGKGRAVETLPVEIPIECSSPATIAKKAMPDFKNDEDTALGQYSCPICLSRPAQPVMTPCGHLMCGACLHLTLLTSIIKELPGAGANSSSNSVEESRRRRRELRGGIAMAQMTVSPRFRQPLTSLKEVKRLSWVGALPPRDINETALRMLEDVKSWDDFGVMKSGAKERGGWLLDGHCPVCRKELHGGLGPRGYGTVIHLEPRKI